MTTRENKFCWRLVLAILFPVYVCTYIIDRFIQPVMQFFLYNLVKRPVIAISYKNMFQMTKQAVTIF